MAQMPLKKKVLSSLTKNDHGVYLALGPAIVQQIVAQLGEQRGFQCRTEYLKVHQ